jgi:hypothetical protein
MGKLSLLVAVALLALVSAEEVLQIPNDSLGDRLLRTFFVFKQMPLRIEGARAAGFKNYDYYGNKNTSCHDATGILLTSSGTAPGRTDQTMLIYNVNGDLAGFGVRAWGFDRPYPLWSTAPTDRLANDLFLTFKDKLCIQSPQNSSYPLGSFLSIQRKFNIPLTRAEAITQNWHRGNCINKMGSHFWYDLKTPGTMTWDALNMVPVLPMYLDDGPNAGHIQAILIASPKFQWVEPVGMYEGPFPNMLFCKNACSSDQPACGKFANAGPWATMHWEFNDPVQATCNNAVCKF